MNEISVTIPKMRKRRTMVIVEGVHEKDILLSSLLTCFPEIKVATEDILIYETNIFILYKDIINEYGADWVDRKDDIDLPYVVSKKNTPHSLSYKIEFTDILLFFDYERQDTYFSDEAIQNMQKTFVDSTDMGKLYINYPMIEAYLHLKSYPDYEYLERKALLFDRGYSYKNIVNAESFVKKFFFLPQKLNELFLYRFLIVDEKVRERCVSSILSINTSKELETVVSKIIKRVVPDEFYLTALNQILFLMKNIPYCYEGVTFWVYLRKIIIYIITRNVEKALKIQEGGNFHIPINATAYNEVDLLKILKIQNECSCLEVSPYIWVLSTAVFFVLDYNKRLVFSAYNGLDTVSVKGTDSEFR